MTCIGMGGAEGLGVRSSLVQRQNFQREMPMAKVQVATPIMAASEVKAQ
jgi:hypothetical protein